MAANTTTNPGSNPLYLGVTKDYKMPDATDIYSMAQQRAQASQQYQQVIAQNRQVLMAQTQLRTSAQTYVQNLQSQKDQENQTVQLRQAQGYTTGGLIYQQNIANQQSANALGLTQDSLEQQQNQLAAISSQFSQQKDAITNTFAQQITQEEFQKQQYANELKAQAAAKKWKIAGWVIGAASLLISFIPVVGPLLSMGIDVGFGAVETIAGATAPTNNPDDWRTGASTTSGAINIGLGVLGGLPLGRMFNAFRGVGRTAAESTSVVARGVADALETQTKALGAELDKVLANTANLSAKTANTIGKDATALTGISKSFKGNVIASALTGDSLMNKISPQALESLMGDGGVLKQAFKTASPTSSSMNKVKDIISTEVGAGRLTEHEGSVFMGFFEQSKNLSKAGRLELLNTMANKVGGVWKNLSDQVSAVVYRADSSLTKQMGKTVSDGIDGALAKIDIAEVAGKNATNSLENAKLFEKIQKGLSGTDVFSNIRNIEGQVARGEVSLAEAQKVISTQNSYINDLTRAVSDFKANFKVNKSMPLFESQLNDLMRGSEFATLDRAAFGAEYTQGLQKYINKTINAASKEGTFSADTINSLKEEIIGGNLIQQFKEGTGVFSEMSAGSLAKTLNERAEFQGLDTITKQSVITFKTQQEAGQTVGDAAEMITKQKGFFKGKFSSIEGWLSHHVAGENLDTVMKFEGGKISWMRDDFKEALMNSKEFSATYNSFKEKYAQRLFRNNGSLTKKQYNAFVKDSPELAKMKNYIMSESAIYKQTGIVYDSTKESAKLVLKKSMPGSFISYGSGVTPGMLRRFSQDHGAAEVWKMILKQSSKRLVTKGAAYAVRNSFEGGLRNKAASNQYLKNSVDRYNLIFRQLGLAPITM